MSGQQLHTFVATNIFISHFNWFILLLTFHAQIKKSLQQLQTYMDLQYELPN